jgi:ribosomal protein L37AE/L43A
MKKVNVLGKKCPHCLKTKYAHKKEYWTYCLHCGYQYMGGKKTVYGISHIGCPNCKAYLF